MWQSMVTPRASTTINMPTTIAITKVARHVLRRNVYTFTFTFTITITFSRVWSGPKRARGPLEGSSGAWDLVNHVVPKSSAAVAVRSPLLSSKANILWMSRLIFGLLVASWRLASENSALVYALASFGRNPGFSSRAAVGGRNVVGPKNS